MLGRSGDPPELENEDPASSQGHLEPPDKPSIERLMTGVLPSMMGLQLVDLIYLTSWLSLAYLKRAQNTYINLLLDKGT